MVKEKKNTHVKPFLKWAGSKKWLIPSIKRFIPTRFNDYYEPFLGSGAVFFALRPKNAHLFDLNNKLIDTFNVLKKNPEKVIQELKNMPHDKDFYYRLRDNFINENKVKQAARIIYLNRTCWNGLYRENKKGDFNVPFGKYINPNICDEDNLRLVSLALKDADLQACDFEEATANATTGDFIFFDPPYITGHQNNGFLYYNSKIFSWEDQERLAKVAKRLHERGCFVLITNAEHKSIKELYNDFKIDRIYRQSVIAANINNRKKVSELIITNYNHDDL